MQRLLLLGDEAIAQGAIDAGISGMYAYPGTPSTEIMEYIQASPEGKSGRIECRWSSNEKTAVETALGMSYCGKRAMAAMKHVGLNVAADAFINSAITGVNGGLIIVAADDPSMHSSQNEQDSRFYGKFAHVPVYEPRNQQEAYDMVFDAFELSEKYSLPVLMRIPTRLAHSRSGVVKRRQIPEKKFRLPDDSRRFILMPAIARKRFKILLENYEKLQFDNRLTKYNTFKDGPDRSLGIIACGIAVNYLMENFSDDELPYPLLSVSTYPFSKDIIKDITGRCREILVLEEGYPLVEEQLRGILDEGRRIYGRMDGTIPRDGELNPDIVASALGIKAGKGHTVPEIVKSRPPSFCKGCGHADMFNAIVEAIKPYGIQGVFSDIGCYTLAALPPYSCINSCVDMGASVTMAIGAADAGLFPSIAVIGDSTFTHSGMPGLLDAVAKNSPVTIIIADNLTTGMTGGQESNATGRLQSICTGIGVAPEHVRTIVPLRRNHEENVRIMREEFEYRGPSVVIATRECIQAGARRRKSEKSEKQKNNEE
ncbi:MAG TPA: indolepyruvate ferredoxin oxidoreductase subunit alpha [Bacteroidales bacterium]|nr:indolepyruvate ferredoxin oxidoreductase subunit alpha [Bacteroidales bacterium]HOK75086.1 indolepyruvate ferredoxin oxidoreductase subunit alpha [Bacteroidales bacterium]HOM40226.1 indolepyruvate ferredoxin oxidoreductase subunit alpha [Bacteroidales bacterium]HPP92955.1 indolepyruvate ferredoxin oxidoreductase subunit alpha [Bacteroidales bacterium]HQK71619.1 indolepyruvate ferredoxin oxidoreductase subunit alpha [Bacteroidales bacterium]